MIGLLKLKVVLKESGNGSAHDLVWPRKDKDFGKQVHRIRIMGKILQFGAIKKAILTALPSTRKYL